MSIESESVAEKPSEQSVVHTPGPWEILDLREKGEECITIAMTTSPQALCRIRNEVSGVPLNQEDLANAKLIAAAPDILAALREIRGELCRRHSPFVVDVDYAYINAAINKATGKVV